MNSDLLKHKILIIDDDHCVRHLLREILKEDHYDIKLAENGEEGLKIFRDWTPQLTFVDLSMPVLDGYEFLEAVNPTPDSPFLIIVLTGYDTDDNIKKCFELGSCMFLKKPPEITEVKRIVEGCFRIKFS